MTSFSDAIVNGFVVSQGLRKQRLNEESVQLDEAYRRDMAAQNQQQFDATHGLDTRKVGLAEREQGWRERTDERDFREGQRQFDTDAKLRSRAVAVDEGRLKFDRDRDSRDHSDKVMGQIAGLLADSLVNGDRADFSSAVTAMLRDKPTRDRFGREVADDDGYFYMASDKSRPLDTAVMTPEGTAFIGTTANGEPRSMTDDRAPGTAGRVTRAPNELVIGKVLAEFRESPSAMAQLRRALAATNMMTPEQAAAADDDTVVETFVKGAAAREQAAAPATPAETTWQSPKQDPRFYMAPHERVFADAASGVRSLADGITGAVRRAGSWRGAGGAPTEPAAAAPSADAAQPSVPAPVPVVTAGLGAPGTTARNQAVRDVYNMQNLGMEPTPADFAASEQYGIPSGSLVAAGLAASTRGAGKTSTATRNMQSVLDLYFPKGNAKDVRQNQMRAEAPFMLDLLDNMTQGAVSEGTDVGRSVAASLSSIMRQAQGESAYAEELRANPHLMAGLAYAGINPATVGQEAFDRAVKNLSNYQNANRASALDFAALGRRLVQTGR